MNKFWEFFRPHPTVADWISEGIAHRRWIQSQPIRLTYAIILLLMLPAFAFSQTIDDAGQVRSEVMEIVIALSVMCVCVMLLRIIELAYRVASLEDKLSTMQARVFDLENRAESWRMDRLEGDEWKDGIEADS